jgi:hypothetical protein
MTSRAPILLLCAAAALTASGLAGPIAAALPDGAGPAAGWIRAMASEAFAQPAPDDDDDDGDEDEDDDPGGDAVGGDDLGNDGADDPPAPPADAIGPTDDDDDDADDDAPPAAGGGAPADDGDDDDGPAPIAPPAGPGAGPGDDGGGDDDDGPVGGQPPANGGGAEPPVSGAPRGEAPAVRDRNAVRQDSPPGGSGVRGVSPDSEGRIRDGDNDRSRPTDLPSGVDLDDRGQWVRSGEILALSTDARALARARTMGFREVERTSLPALGMVIVRLRAPAGRPLAASIAALRSADPDNAYDFNHLYRQSQARAAPARRSAPAARRAPATRARPAPAPATPQRSATRGVVGMIDGPVAISHPSLTGAQVTNRSFAASAAGRDMSHGTAVASLLVGQDGSRLRSGLPGGRLLAADVVSAQASGFDLGAATGIVQALDWIIGQGGPVVNISMAGPPNAILEEAVRRAVARGVIIVAAVGNDGPAAPPRYPAAYPDVIGVTAVDAGGVVYRRAGRGAHVDIAAIGVNVTAASAPRAYSQTTGTSFAAPIVASTLARTHRRPDPAMAARIVAAAVAGARDAGPPGRDPVYGAGIVEPDRIVATGIAAPERR